MKIVSCKLSVSKLSRVCIMFMLLLVSCKQETNPDFVGICKDGDNKVRLLYFDMRGISDVETSVSSDTLFLHIQVSLRAKQEYYYLNVPSGVSYIRYGDVTKDIHGLDECIQPHSYEQALEEYKKELEK